MTQSHHPQVIASHPGAAVTLNFLIAPSSKGQFVNELILLSDNRALSTTELVEARRICDELTAATVGRDEYLRTHKVDKAFALPDANWSYDAPNEFVQLFKRIAKGCEEDLNRLRGFTQVFSGYNLYEVADGKGHRAATMQFNEGFEARLEGNLVARNLKYIDPHKAQIADIPPALVLRPPVMLGEVGHMVDGVLVNHDTFVYQERINILYYSGLADLVQRKIEATGKVNICEIGGGYGALCRWFMEVFPQASYTIVDLPESLLFSRLYASLTKPGLAFTFGLDPANPGVRFTPNYMAEELDDSFDLIINTLSMSEMTEYQVRKYAGLMSTSWLKEDGVFFEQNHDSRYLGLICAQDVLASEFEFHYPLRSATKRFGQGLANLWALNPLPPVNGT